MKMTLLKTPLISVVAPLVAGMGLLTACVSQSEPDDRPSTVYNPGHYPPPQPDYQPTPYPTYEPPPSSLPPGPAPAHLPPDGWVVLGTTVANYEVDHDTIHVRGRFDLFRRLRFKVTGAPLNLHRLIVTYDDGRQEEIRTSQKIRRGSTSRVINLHTPRSGMRRIDFYYDTRGFAGQRAEVTVFARR